MKEHPNVIKQRAFEKLKAYFVKAYNEQNVCCCRYHMEINMLREGFNQIRDEKKGLYFLENYQCVCDMYFF